MLAIKQATTTIVAQSGFPQSSGFSEGLTDSSELPVHKVLAHVRAQLNGSDIGAFHKAVYLRVSAGKQHKYVTNIQTFTDVYMYIDNIVCSTLVLDTTQNIKLYEYYPYFTVFSYIIPLLCFITMNYFVIVTFLHVIFSVCEI